jgi:CubicO group peptidase (beta-lactamase class C family)
MVVPLQATLNGRHFGEHSIMGTAAIIPLDLLLGRLVKPMCSALWVSGRKVEEAEATSIFYDQPALRAWLTLHVDQARRTVSYTITLNADTVPRLIAWYRTLYPDFEANWDQEAKRLLAQGSVTRTAQYVGDQGCILMPTDGSGLKFTPVEVKTTLPEATTQDWPMGDRLPDSFTGLDPARVQEAVHAAFANPDSCTAAVVVVHRGHLVGERYAPGCDLHSQLESWSMGKSLTATLLGLLIHQGLLDLEAPAPVPAWQTPGDPRHAIRLIDLLRMSSGLKFTRDEPRHTWEHGVPDHLLVYADAINVFEFSLNRPLEHPPNTIGRYRNCDPLILGAIIKRTVVEQLGEDYLSWPQHALFDRLGIRRQVMETDSYGNFILTGYDYGTARNWARLGLLYAQDGVWNGARLLPEGYAQLVGTPAPAWREPEYGGQFWVNGTGKYPIPRDAYYMAGVCDQRVFIIPSHDLVVVRLGHRRGSEPGKADLDTALSKLIAAVEAA